MQGITHGIVSFFGSVPGMYVAQSFFHALVAAILADRAVEVWKITNPLVIQRFRLTVILCAIFSFPAYQAINSRRGSLSFRLGALFDSSRWLQLELPGHIPLGMIFLAVLALVSLLFLVQEVIPVVRHILESKEEIQKGLVGDYEPSAGTAMDILPAERPPVHVIDDEDPVIFSTTGRDPAIYLSRGLIAMLEPEEMKAAIAHELAHIERNRRPLLIAVFLLRIVMFFNPVVLLEFRKAVQDEENICDDQAVALTGDPCALAVTLRKIHREPGELDLAKLRELSKLRDSLEEHSLSTHLQNRIMRLEAERTDKTRKETGPFVVTVVTVAVLNYFIV